jgi:ATP-dependent Clp protease ATP-binding subunit ClpA
MTPPPSLQDLIDTVRQDTRTDNAIDQLVTAAAAVAQLEDTSDALLGHFVDRCRREGRSWSEISTALGVTKQAVHKRFATNMADQIIAAVPATFERFTPRARKVVGAASRLAQEAGRGEIGSADLLVGLFAEPRGVAAVALQAMNVSRESVLAAIRATAGGGGAGTGSAAASPASDADAVLEAKELTFAADGQRAMRDALAIALEFGHNYIGTEHLLLGLYRDASSPAAVILTAAGTTQEQARVHVAEILRGFEQPEA